LFCSLVCSVFRIPLAGIALLSLLFVFFGFEVDSWIGDDENKDAVVVDMLVSQVSIFFLHRYPRSKMNNGKVYFICTGQKHEFRRSCKLIHYVREVLEIILNIESSKYGIKGDIDTE
jgi:hypothetical protein